MKRVELISNYGEFQAGVSIPLEDEDAERLVKRGTAVLSKQQSVFGHIEEMPESLQKKAVEHLEIAAKAGTYRDQGARSAALAPFRK